MIKFYKQETPGESIRVKFVYPDGHTRFARPGQTEPDWHPTDPDPDGNWIEITQQEATDLGFF